jgi:AraC-like DNA-binding protein
MDVPDNVLLFRRGSASELKDGTLQPHFHHRWVLIAPLRGSGSVLVDGASYPLRPGTMLLVPPLRLHRYEGVSRGKISWLFVTFELSAQDARSAKPVLGRLTRESRAILGDALHAWNSLDTSAAATARLATHVALLLLALRRTAGTERESREPGTTQDLLARINAWLESHLESRARLGTMARALGVSESHLRALFRDRHGISLGRYARETRCRLAALHLQRGHRSITEVASACGFGSVYSFSRTFKRVLGTTPGAMARRGGNHGA